MSTETTIFIGVAIYMVLMLVVGAYASRKSKTTAAFMVAGRGMPMFICTATIVATWFGGGSMMAVSGAAYDDGLFGVIADPFGATLALILIGLFFARFFRRLRMMTYVELIQQRYGTTATVLMTATNIFANTGWVGGMLVAFGVVFESLTGTPMVIGITAGAVVVITYTMIGGLWAVALTDFVQIIIILVGLIVLFVVVLIDVGGWSTISEQLPENTFRLLPLENTPERWLNYLRAWLIFGLADVTSQTLLGRAMAAKSEREAQNSFYFASIGYFSFAMLPVLLGIIASVTMPGLSNSEGVVPALAMQHLHPVAVALFVGAMMAAIMSTCDSALLASASLIGRNILPLIQRNPSDALTLRVTRWAIPAIGITAIVVAMKVQAIFDLILDANVPALTAMTVPFILAVWWKKANRIGALSGMFAGFAAWFITRIVAPELPGDIIGLGACFVTMIVVSLATQEIDPPRPARDIDGNVVEFKDRLGILRKSR
jgi:SSS family transporter